MALGRTSAVLLAGVIALGGIVYVMTPPGSAAPGWASSTDMIRDEFRTARTVRPLSPDAARVALSALSMSTDPVNNTSLAALTSGPAARIELGGGTLEVAVTEDGGQDAAHRLFSPDAGEHSPVVLDRGARNSVVAVNYERSFEAYSEREELDVSITPRAGLSVGPAGSAAGAGAEVRIGQYLQASRLGEPRWFVFAGADRRALMYDPREGIDLRHAMALTQRQVVGDAQAGVAVRFGDADLSLAYVRREYKHVAGVRSFDETEEFGAITVNWTW